MKAAHTDPVASYPELRLQKYRRHYISKMCAKYTSDTNRWAKLTRTRVMHPNHMVSPKMFKINRLEEETSILKTKKDKISQYFKIMWYKEAEGEKPSASLVAYVTSTMKNSM